MVPHLSARFIPLLALILYLIPQPSLLARQIRVPQDYNNIQLAVNHSAENDTVAISPGVYTEGRIDFDRDVHLIGLGNSPDETVLDAEGSNHVLDYGYISSDPGVCPPVRVENLTLRGATRWAIRSEAGQHLFVTRCLITGNPGGAIDCHGIFIWGSRLTIRETTIAGNGQTDMNMMLGTLYNVVIERSIIAGNLGSAECLYVSEGLPSYQIQCVNHFERPWNSWTGFLEPYGDTGNNFSADPRFIDPMGDFRLAADSPCLPANNPCGQLIGALGEGPGPPGFTARFWVEPHSDWFPADVQFHALDFDQPLVYRWDTDGDGDWDTTGNHPVVHYDQAGIYCVTLEVSDFLGREEIYTLEDCIHLGGRRLLVPEEYESIADAMAISIPGDSVFLACGMYTVNDVDFGQGVYLGSMNNNPDCVTLEGRLQGRILDAGDTDSLTVRGITFQNAWALGNGGAILSGKRITAVDCRFISKLAISGGAMASTTVWSEDDNVIRNCVFETNHAESYGGAVSNVVGTYTDCRFVGNNSGENGGAACLPPPGSLNWGTSRLERCVFLDNESPVGGAVYAGNAGIIDCQFFGNSAAVKGGALRAGSLSLRNCGLFGNSSLGNGGAISSSRLEVWNCVIQGNSAGVAGGAIHGVYAVFAFLNCTITGNHAPVGSVIHGDPLDCRWNPGITMRRSIVAFNGTQRPFELSYYEEDLHPPVIEESCLWSEGGFDWTGIEEFQGQDCNLELDPLFCDLENGDLHLSQESPCDSYNNDCEVTMGYSQSSCNPVTVSDPVLPASLTLYAAPNPFNSRTTLRIQLPKSEVVHIEMYDLLGRRVLQLLDEELPAGEHMLPIEGSGLASGVYFLQARTGQGTTAVQKVLLVK